MRRITALFAGGVLALALFGAAMAGPLEDGEAAYQKGDYAAAMSYWHPLAEQGDAAAQANLGLMYDTGSGVPQDYAEALVWYRKAADQGYAIAQFNLGQRYEHGRGVPSDYVHAHMWLSLAALRAGDATVAQQSAVKDRDEVAAKMTPEQIAEAQRLAREWKPK